MRRPLRPQNAHLTQRKTVGPSSAAESTLHARNFSGKAMEQRTKFQFQKNRLQSENALAKIAKDKEARQYASYLGNVETLNRMKQALKDIYPAMDDMGGKKQKLVSIILNYERDIQEYVNNWSA